MCFFLLDSKARSTAKSMSSYSCKTPPYSVVVILFSFLHLMNIQAITIKNGKPAKTQPCLTPDLTSVESL